MTVNIGTHSQFSTLGNGILNKTVFIHVYSLFYV